jgi:Alpha/beta hydrolase of unknown function (DUF900)
LKRRYWQGYQGRFGSFRWPTDNNFGGIGSGARNTPLNDPQNYDRSEFSAWKSGKPLRNFLAILKSSYLNNIYLIAHSMGNIVAGEALRTNSPIVNTYIAMQGAVPAHAYDPTASVRVLNSIGANLDSNTPNRYAQYFASGAPCYFNGVSGAGTYVNFYNTNDWALNANIWQLNQDIKPAIGYGYNTTTGQFFQQVLIANPLNFPTDTYKIFSYCDEARCFALGAQPNVGGKFTGNEVNLPSVWPPDPSAAGYRTHIWHSAQFRSDAAHRWQFWDNTLIKLQLKAP